MGITDPAFEREFLVEYFIFGRVLGAYEGKAHLQAHDKATSQEQRRIHFVNLHSTVANSYETLAALLLAMRRNKSTKGAFLETLLTYKPGQARLDQVVGRIKSVRGFCRCFGITPKNVKAHGFPMSAFNDRISDFVRSTHLAAKEQKRRLYF